MADYPGYSHGDNIHADMLQNLNAYRSRNVPVMLLLHDGEHNGFRSRIESCYGQNWKTGSIFMIVITLACYFAKGVYSKVEKIITLCIVGMIICFFATLVSTASCLLTL